MSGIFPVSISTYSRRAVQPSLVKAGGRLFAQVKGKRCLIVLIFWCENKITIKYWENVIKSQTNHK